MQCNLAQKLTDLYVEQVESKIHYWHSCKKSRVYHHLMLYQLWVDVWLHYRWCSPLWGWMGSGCVGEWWWAETKCCLADWVRDTHTCKIEVTSNYTLNRLRKTLAKLMHVNVVLLPLYMISTFSACMEILNDIHCKGTTKLYSKLYSVIHVVTDLLTLLLVCVYRKVQPRSLIDPYKYDKNSWTSCFSDRKRRVLLYTNMHVHNYELCY